MDTYSTDSNPTDRFSYRDASAEAEAVPNGRLSPTPTRPLTFREGLARYYAANPDFIQDRDMQVLPFHIPWQNLLRHDLMHVVTGYSTDLGAELQLLGFLTHCPKLEASLVLLWVVLQKLSEDREPLCRSWNYALTPKI